MIRSIKFASLGLALLLLFAAAAVPAAGAAGLDDLQKAKQCISRGVTKATVFSDFEGAIVEFDKAIALDPGNFQAYLQRGICRADYTHDYAGAVSDLSQAARLDPQGGSYSCFYYRALANFKLGNAEAALEDVNLALKRKEDPGALALRAEIERSMNDDRAASADELKVRTLVHQH